MLTRDDIAALASRLPSIPQALSEALEEMNRPEVDIARVAAMLAKDQKTTLSILRVANSAFYGLSRRVASLSEAVQIIGLPGTRSLVTSYAVTGRFRGLTNPGFDHAQLWRHSFRVATAARNLAPRLATNRETAFLAGLLHDIGKLLLGCHAPLEYRGALDRVRERGCSTLEAEKAVLGMSHAEIGAALAEQWRFPEVIRSAILDHHAPRDEPAAHIVHAADVLACALEGSVAIDDIGSRLAAETRRLLALEESDIAELLDQAESQAAGLLGMLEGGH